MRAAQGHPKLLELADALAADPAALEAHLAQAESASGGADASRLAFFEKGESDRPEDDFVQELRRWTDGVAQALGPTARLLAQFLARLEDEDRTMDVVQANWEDFLKRLTGERGEEKQPAPQPARAQAQAALGEPGLGLEAALKQLAQAGLVEIETTTSQQPQLTPESFKTLLPILAAQNPQVAALLSNPQGVSLPALLPHLQAALADPTGPALQAWLNDQQATVAAQQFHLHPGVAEALLLACPPAVLDAADTELGDFHLAVYSQGIKTELQGGGRRVVEGARRTAPYLLRAQRWNEAATLLERMIQRDASPGALALAIPLLRHIAEKTRGTEREMSHVGVLANALIWAGRYAEAEATLRDLIARWLAQGDCRLASNASGQLFSLLLLTGRYAEALQTAEEMAGYSRRAGLGPWTQLLDAVNRLQALNALGRYAEVLAAVEQHRA